MHWIKLSQPGGPLWINLAQVTHAVYIPARTEGDPEYDHPARIALRFNDSGEGERFNQIEVEDLDSMAAIGNRLDLLAAQALRPCGRCEGLTIVVNDDGHNETCPECGGCGEVTR